ncbi:MAG: hypothetical protein M2R45_01164 [Verrucomicrobia subdivision 3 bacterium]|nr:hypothetical protein [Limisphaerales bacterium]MCS1415283.1 hypothetical protein [Limisphaerales bacterium]
MISEVVVTLVVDQEEHNIRGAGLLGWGIEQEATEVQSVVSLVFIVT